MKALERLDKWMGPLCTPPRLQEENPVVLKISKPDPLPQYIQEYLDDSLIMTHDEYLAYAASGIRSILQSISFIKFISKDEYAEYVRKSDEPELIMLCIVIGLCFVGIIAGINI